MTKQSMFHPYRQEIERLVSEGLTSQEIVDRLPLETNALALRKYLKREGIPLRTRPGGQPGSKHWKWNGGTAMQGRYRLVSCPGHPQANRHGYVQEHRLVMEQKLGRYLEPHEVVHHIDDDPLNNDPENLQLFASNGAHLAATRKGKTPNWSEAGYARIRAAHQRWLESRQQASDTPTE